MKRKTSFFFAGAMLVLAFYTQTANTQVPQLIDYQARLVNPETNIPVEDGTYSIVFSIYDVPTEGIPIWVETQSVPISNGVYSVLLGSVTPIKSSLFSSSERYFGIAVGSNPEMTPRIQIVSVSYALVSDNTNNLDGRPANDYAAAIHGHNDYSIDFNFLTNAPINISHFNNDAGYISQEQDSSVINEIQVLSLSNDTLYLSNGGFVKLPSSFSGNYNDLTNKPTAGTGISINGSNVISETRYEIGQSAQGGIIFWVDETGEHGLVSAAADVGAYPWANNNVIRYTCTFNSTGIGSGEMNTMLIVALQYNDNPVASPTFAASACAYFNYTTDVTYGDWYLPSSYELRLMYTNLFLTGRGGFNGTPYWSSTEYQSSNTMAYMINFGGGGAETATDKRNTFPVRPMRRF